ncbi:MAG: hypothetical protein LBR69_00860 [Endomicrobium sp.]|jgi:hypothetical protein|nr:hypothetical protein [Endomicrobium sp.]
MNLKRAKGSVLLMVTVFAMIFLILSVLTMKVLFSMDQDQGVDGEIARLRLFYAADGISEIAMYAAAKNLMYDPAGHIPSNNAAHDGTQRIITSYKMRGDIWPNVWSIASGVHPNYDPTLLPDVVYPNPPYTQNVNFSGVPYTILSSGINAKLAAETISLNPGIIADMPPLTNGTQLEPTDPISGEQYVYDVDFNVTYKSNSQDPRMVDVSDGNPLKWRKAIRYNAGGMQEDNRRMIWHMHLTPENPNYVEANDYAASDFWIVHHPEMSPDNNVMVRAYMYQEFVLPPKVDSLGNRDSSDSDLIRAGDGWPNVDVNANVAPSWFYHITVPDGAQPNANKISDPAGNFFYGRANAVPGAFINNPIPNQDNHYYGGNARRRFFAIIAEARFNDQSKGGVFSQIYRIETRFFIEDERTYGGVPATARQYNLYPTDIDDNVNPPIHTNKPRVKFYFRSRIPRPI